MLQGDANSDGAIIDHAILKISKRALLLGGRAKFDKSIAARLTITRSDNMGTFNGIFGENVCKRFVIHFKRQICNKKTGLGLIHVLSQNISVGITVIATTPTSETVVSAWTGDTLGAISIFNEWFLCFGLCQFNIDFSALEHLMIELAMGRNRILLLGKGDKAISKGAITTGDDFCGISIKI